MSLAEIRAAAPQLAWSDVMVSRYTGRVFSMRSDDTLMIAGVEFRIEALAHYYQHRLQFDGVTQAADAAACERAGLDVLTAIEAQAGPFVSGPPRTTPPSGGGLYWRTQRSANGSISVVPGPSVGSPGRTEGETVSFGKGSTALVEAFDDKYRPRSRVKRIGSGPAFLQMHAYNRGDGYSVDAEVSYGKDSGSLCAVRLEVERWTQPPLPQIFDTSKARSLHTPSIAQRHIAHSPLAGQPGPAIEAELDCEIDRRTGWVFSCGLVRPDGVNPAQEQVAQYLVRMLAFDVSGVDRDDPQMMRGTVRVRVDPADRRALDFLGEPRTNVDDIEFTAKPDPEAARLMQPVLGVDERNSVEVRVTCRVEADGSLICADPEGAIEPERKALVATASRVAAMEYSVAPQLRSGGSSAGRVFDLTLEVQPAF